MQLDRVFSFQIPTAVSWGYGASREVGNKARALGANRIFLATDPGVARTGMPDKISEVLSAAGLGVERYEGVSPDPDVSVVDDAFQRAKKAGCDALVAIGGGSSIDVAKAVGLMLSNGGDSIEEYLLGRPIQRPNPPVIAIPTTCGTGSEVTTSAVISDKKRKKKISLRQGTLLCASAAVIDPGLMTSLPPRVVATTGLDALTHAIEAYLSHAGFPLTDACALHAIELIAANLRPAAANPANLQAIGNMGIASTVAGFAFGQASTTLVHCMSHALGAHFDVPHGLANAVLLPYVMEYNLPANLPKFARVARALGGLTDGLTDLDAADLGVRLVRRLISDLSIPSRLGEIGVSPEAIPAMARDAAAEKRIANNPRRATEKEIAALFERAM
ncbi:MAG: iron-containing alcohol dehydrogenase [Actinobacteria bacterium]|nr:iron-containing alcohol dehydrogenase [Actinomycetota bacterium]